MNENTAQLKAALASWASGVLEDSLPIVVEGVRPLAPLGKPSLDPESGYVPGGLRDSIQTVGGVTTTSGSRFSGRVIAAAPQGAYTDRGTPAHPIFPKSPTGRLRFYSTKAGAVIFMPPGRGVNHPGNPAQHWWEAALRRVFGEALVSAARSRSFG